MAQKRVNWSKYAPHPSITLILGGRGEGKTATLCSIFHHFKKREKRRVIIVGSKKYTSNYPKWINRHTTGNFNFPNNSVVGLDDAHLYLYAREWGIKEERQKRKTFDFLARESRHKDLSFIITTQQARVVDINVISMVDCLIIKKPSLLQAEFERKQLQDLFEDAENKLKGKGKGWAYIVYRGGRQVIGPYSPPKWFTKKISKGYGEVELVPTKTKKKSGLRAIIVNGIKMVGRMS